MGKEYFRRRKSPNHDPIRWHWGKRRRDRWPDGAIARRKRKEGSSRRGKKKKEYLPYREGGRRSVH